LRSTGVPPWRVPDTTPAHTIFLLNSTVPVWNHVYDDNFDNDDFSTEYIVFAYKFCLDEMSPSRKSAIVDALNDKMGATGAGEGGGDDEYKHQHGELRWIPIATIEEQPLVHEFCKNYYKVN